MALELKVSLASWYRSYPGSISKVLTEINSCVHSKIICCDLDITLDTNSER